MKIIEDAKSFHQASNNYDAYIATLNNDASLAGESRSHRQFLLQEKIKAAENLIMSVMGDDKASLSRAGLLTFFEQLASGNYAYSPRIIFTIAEHIADYKLKNYKP